MEVVNGLLIQSFISQPKAYSHPLAYAYRLTVKRNILKSDSPEFLYSLLSHQELWRVPLRK
ncbi:hypothetical protein RMSM_06956 [Rhodopirellula maiorica SM1]|uniref:Uncharacterized protein n=1 Tax=Rhodopirellula maiorica SM1 TaxID=1265738 RepID=M5RQ83_9BACT|nr:hypothetical protein RMSM_06956 [Rhodopirellula maiorica SM1]